MISHFAKFVGAMFFCSKRLKWGWKKKDGRLIEIIWASKCWAKICFIVHLGMKWHVIPWKDFSLTLPDFVWDQYDPPKDMAGTVWSIVSNGSIKLFERGTVSTWKGEVLLKLQPKKWISNGRIRHSLPKSNPYVETVSPQLHRGTLRMQCQLNLRSIFKVKQPKTTNKH